MDCTLPLLQFFFLYPSAAEHFRAPRLEASVRRRHVEPSAVFDKLQSEKRLVEAVNPHGWDGGAARRAVRVLLSSASCSSYGATSWNLRQCRRSAFRSELIGSVRAYARAFVCCTADIDVLFHCSWQEKNTINLHSFLFFFYF